MAKGRGIKDLRNIHQIFGSQKPESPFADQLAAHEKEPPPAEDIRDAILSLMANYHGWTVGDVQRCLAKHPDTAQIPTIMNKFANEGKFEITTITGRANMYTLKRKPVETITSARNAAAAVKPWKHQDPIGTRQAPDPKGVIKLEEGLDVAIWKIMSDGKYRTKNEICKMLVEYKFDRIQVNRRVESMINSRNYFDRRDGGSGGMMYAQKKHIPMPAIQNAEPTINPAFANIRENLSETITKKFDSSTPAQIEFSGHLSHGHGAGGAADDTSLQAIDRVIAEERVYQEQEAAAHDAAAKPIVEEPLISAPNLTITKDDTNYQAIWKAICDHKWYIASEVTLLVQAGNPEVNTASIAASLTKMWQQQILERKPVEGTRSFSYRLLEGKPMPADNRLWKQIPKAQQDELKAAVKQEPQQQMLPGVQTPEAKRAEELVNEINARREASATQPNTNQETEMSKATQAGATSLVNVKPASAPAAPVALLNTDIHIKGVAFTRQEANQLVAELTALGYANEKVRQLSMVNQSVEIKGLNFTSRELCELVSGLMKEGFGK
jgi:hypothetical protein